MRAVLILTLLLLSAQPARPAGTEVIDRFMRDFIARHEIPDAGVAVSRDGRLLYARGFGWADKEQRVRLRPSSLFRIASLSKPVTAVAILRLVESGKLSLDAPVARYLKGMDVYRANPGFDRRMELVTVRDLLRHSGGWDRNEDFDPMGRTGHLRIARALGLTPPIQPRDYIEWMFGRPLQFDPGSRFAYSNFGYLLLGRVIEDVTDRTYEEHVREHILKPIGVTAMRIGRMAEEDRAENEVKYYTPGQRKEIAPFGPHRGKPVPAPYARPIRVMDAHGGWIASPVDLLRFAESLDRLLKPASLAALFDRQPGRLGYQADGRPKPAFYALGWMVRPKGSGANHWHTGAIQGTSTLLVRRHDGFKWAILFNTGATPQGKRPASLIDGPMHRVIDSVTRWPAGDLFPEFDQAHR